MNTNKTRKTELVFILDKSGSMSGLESDTIGGYNAMLKKQQQAPGEARVTTVLFDDGYEVLHDRIDIRGVAPITENDYYVGGCTALLDAIGKTIHKIANAQRYTQPEHRSEQIIFVITTDGLENASQEYSYEKIKCLIELEKTEYQWEFIFLGANIDAIETAARFGISADRAANYHADGQGTQLNYRVVSEVVSEIRACNPISANWKAEIDEDFELRKKNR
ncbi:vWA domain-containing protein [Acetobacterium wieringae]|uniref:vWA domain-containing protein n=1 Tax=Acetobacterium wieringae TaxID=52694 RepID=UPI0026F02156|nr:vWA domain-containing protein [Acetobacterium wieringae]